MRKNSILISLIFLGNALISFAAQIFLTRHFGAESNLDQFLLAVTLPTLFITLLYGTINDTYQPLAAHWDNRELKKGYSTLIWSWLLVSTTFSGLCVMLAPQLLGAFYGQQADKDVITLFSWLMLAVPFAAIIAVMGAQRNFEQKVLRLPTAQLIGAIANFGMLVFLLNQFGVEIAVYGFLVSTIIQVIFVWKNTSLEYHFPIVKNFFSLWIPLLAGTFFFRMDTLLTRVIASSLAEGEVVTINLATRMISMGVGLTTIGLQTTFLPKLLEHRKRNDNVSAQALVKKVKGVTLAVSLLAALGIWLITPILFRIVFFESRFSPTEQALTLQYLPALILPALGWGSLSIFLQPLYAHKKHAQVALLGSFCFFASWWVIKSSGLLPAHPQITLAVSLSILLVLPLIIAHWLTRKYDRTLVV